MAIDLEILQNGRIRSLKFWETITERANNDEILRRRIVFIYGSSFPLLNRITPGKSREIYID